MIEETITIRLPAELQTPAYLHLVARLAAAAAELRGRALHVPRHGHTRWQGTHVPEHRPDELEAIRRETVETRVDTMSPCGSPALAHLHHHLALARACEHRARPFRAAFPIEPATRSLRMRLTGSCQPHLGERKSRRQGVEGAGDQSRHRDPFLAPPKFSQIGAKGVQLHHGRSFSASKRAMASTRRLTPAATASSGVSGLG